MADIPVKAESQAGAEEEKKPEVGAANEALRKKKEKAKAKKEAERKAKEEEEKKESEFAEY